VVNLSGVPPEEANCLALGKGPNYSVTPVLISVKDIIRGVVKSVGTLPEETAEIIQENLWIRNSPVNQRMT
jgi:hypothetical protein